MPTRRDFLANSGAVAATLAWPSLAHAQLQLGEMQIDVVSDGSLTLPGDFIFAPMPQDELDPILKEFGQSRETLTPECNVTLLRDGTRTVLFDVGSGPDFAPNSGVLLDSLDTLGVAPEDVTDVVFTHGHPDHLWGLLDDFGDPLFTEASYMIGKTEWDYWMNPNTVDEIASYGHTPGHMSFEVRNGNTSAMIVGDSIGNHHVAFARPDWTSGSDQDPETATQTRLSLLDQLSSAKMQLIGFHLPGGLGHVEKSGDAYTFVGGA